MRMKSGVLTEFQQAVMGAIGDDEVYGTQIARTLGLRPNATGSGYSRLYRTLHRLSALGLVTSRMEPARDAERERRPRRRLYRASRRQHGDGE
jgi:DNA-binding PadR family transcriptional regulator